MHLMGRQRERNPSERLRGMAKERIKADSTGCRQKGRTGQWETASSVNGRANKMKEEERAPHLTGEQLLESDGCKVLKSEQWKN